MMHGKAIWKVGISEIAKSSTDSAPYEPIAARANVVTYVGLWPTAIKLNPSWKTEVSRSAWIKPCHTNEYHPNALFPGNKICHWLLSFHDSNYFTILWRWSKSISIRRFFCPYFSGQEKLRIRTVFTQWWATSSCFFFWKIVLKEL